MQSSVTPAKQVRSSRLNWGLIVSMIANAVLVVGIVVLIKAILTLGVTRLFGIE